MVTIGMEMPMERGKFLQPNRKEKGLRTGTYSLLVYFIFFSFGFFFTFKMGVVFSFVVILFLQERGQCKGYSGSCIDTNHLF